MLQSLNFIILLIPSFVNAFQYPSVKRIDTLNESHFGVEVTDAYRWLENPDTEERKKFINEQNEVTKKYIDTNPYKSQIRKGLTDLMNYPKYGVPIKIGPNYYFSLNSGLQNQPIIYYSKELNDINPKVFIDPNKFSSDGTTSLNDYDFSPDYKWCVYGINEGGGDWIKLRVKNVETGIDLNETLIKIKFYSTTWSPDSLGFFYPYFDEYKGKADSSDNGSPNNSKIFYHRLNTSQSMDIMIAKFPEQPLAILRSEVSYDGKYLHIFPIIGTQNNLWYYCHLDGKPINSSLKMNAVIDKPEAIYEYITNDDSITYIFTQKNAPNFRLVAIDLKNPKEENWINVIQEHSKDILQYVLPINKTYLVAAYLRDVTSVLELRRLSDGHYYKDIKLPIGTLQTLSGRRNDSILFFSVTSFLIPYIVYSYDFNEANSTNQMKIYRKSQVSDSGFDSEQFITKQIFYNSGQNLSVKVPMFLIHHKNITQNGNNPTVLYAYGGFGISMTPHYSAFIAYFINHIKGVYALANIRGGGEYGENWHKSGMLLNKQNVFDDFHAAAEYLIKNNYTNRNKLTINGGSNGGLLIGATSNQRPELYGCAVAQVGVMDMLRFHKFTVGYAWIPEYGNPDEEIHFRNILKYSPLNNVPTNITEYPSILLTTADHDDRVVPSHSFKFVSQLQYSLGNKISTPLMIRIDSMAGHGGGKSLTKSIDEFTDIISFVMNALKLHL